jgi:hypothetical protein
MMLFQGFTLRYITSALFFSLLDFHSQKILKSVKRERERKRTIFDVCICMLNF